MPTLRERIEERFPDIIPLLENPEIAWLVAMAVNPDEPKSTTWFQSQLRNTQWYKGQSQSQREWWVTMRSDPGQANLKRAQYRAELSQFAIQLGTPLTGPQLAWLTERGLAEGMAVNDPRMLGELRKLMKPSAGKGTIGVAASQIRALAEKTWYVRPSSSSINKTAIRVATGLDTIESVNARYAAQATKRFPHLASRIQGGETLADITSNYRQVIAEELELDSPEAVDPMRGEWRSLLGVPDPKTKKTRMLTEQEVIARARSRASWWNTQNGRQLDAQATTMALRMFGQRA